MKEEMLKTLKDSFSDTSLAKGYFQAPGRVNLIGEHTDYNEGLVLPMAIEKEIAMAAQRRGDAQVQILSLQYNEMASFPMVGPYPTEPSWARYCMAVARELYLAGYRLGGANIVVHGTIPQGAGLSSSAALEVVSALCFSQLNGLNLEPLHMAHLCWRGERDFVGVQCGIMDQLISCLGKKGHALQIHCGNHTIQSIPMPHEQYRIVLCNSLKERNLLHSPYNERRRECQEALTRINAGGGAISALGELTPEELHRFDLPPTLRNRVRHVVEENQRVSSFVEAVECGDMDAAGAIMNESHDSLRFAFEVSCEELDVLVELAQKHEGVKGARMTGAGFGGCTVQIVEADMLKAFEVHMREGYRRSLNREMEIYISRPAQGAWGELIDHE